MVPIHTGGTSNGPTGLTHAAEEEILRRRAHWVVAILGVWSGTCGSGR